MKTQTNHRKMRAQNIRRKKNKKKTKTRERTNIQENRRANASRRGVYQNMREMLHDDDEMNLTSRVLLRASSLRVDVASDSCPSVSSAISVLFFLQKENPGYIVSTGQPCTHFVDHL